MSIANEDLQDYVFLEQFEQEELWSKEDLNRGRRLLQKLCRKLDKEEEPDVDTFYELTQAMAEDFNAMSEAGVRIDASAREAIETDVQTIAEAYGLDIDVEEALSTREW